MVSRGLLPDESRKAVVMRNHEAALMQNLESLAAELGLHLQQQGIQLALAESCTGGLIAQAMTAIAGSSAWFERGFVTYSNDAKVEMLGVDAALIARYGAVSPAVAQAMAEGALSHSHAQVSGAVTGIAGPGGGSAEKPVGMVCFAWASQTQDGTMQSRTDTQYFQGDRAAVRLQAALHVLAGLRETTH